MGLSIQNANNSLILSEIVSRISYQKNITAKDTWLLEVVDGLLLDVS